MGSSLSTAEVKVVFFLQLVNYHTNFFNNKYFKKTVDSIIKNFAKINLETENETLQCSIRISNECKCKKMNLWYSIFGTSFFLLSFCFTSDLLRGQIRWKLTRSQSYKMNFVFEMISSVLNFLTLRYFNLEHNL